MANNERFLRFIQGHPPSLPILPAIHTTNMTSFSRIISNGFVDITQCKFYNEALVYLFYGKPAYRVRGNTDAATRILGDAAVSFVFDTLSLKSVHRLYALDTGASFGERYNALLPQGLNVDDFSLPPDVELLTSLVNAFFGNNRSYFDGELRMIATPPALDLASQAYADIVRSTISSDFDERACTCEIQLNHRIEIKNSNLITIVMPSIVYDDLEVKNALAYWGVKPLLYRFRRARASDRTEVIFEKLGDLYSDRGLI